MRLRSALQGGRDATWTGCECTPVKPAPCSTRLLVCLNTEASSGPSLGVSQLLGPRSSRRATHRAEQQRLVPRLTASTYLEAVAQSLPQQHRRLVRGDLYLTLL